MLKVDRVVGRSVTRTLTKDHEVFLRDVRDHVDPTNFHGIFVDRLGDRRSFTRIVGSFVRRCKPNRQRNPAKANIYQAIDPITGDKRIPWISSAVRQIARLETFDRVHRPATRDSAPSSRTKRNERDTSITIPPFRSFDRHQRTRDGKVLTGNGIPADRINRTC